MSVTCIMEVFLHELLHNYSRESLGGPRLEAATFSKLYKRLGGCPRTVPPDHGGDRIESHTEGYTEWSA